MKKISAIVAWGIVGAIGPLAVADSVSIRPADAPAGAKPTVYSDVKVAGVADGKLTFQMSSGNNVTKDFSTVVGLTLDDEPAFNAAEAAFNAGKFDDAVDKYDQTMSKTDKAWLKDYCITKLADSADKSGRFDKAVDAFITLVKKNPELAAKHKPATPDTGSTYLDGAATTLNAAVDSPGLKPEQQDMLLDLLLSVQTARKDSAAVDVVAKKLAHSAPAVTPGETRAPVAPAVAAAQIDAKMAEIHTALDAKKYDDAVNMINGSMTLYTDVPHKSEALWLLAQARDGQATAKDTDDDAWKDAALAYMTVVADFKDQPNKPHVADSLMRTGAILEKLKLNKEAMETYLSVVKDFSKDAVAAKAQQEADRLKAATKPG